MMLKNACLAVFFFFLLFIQSHPHLPFGFNGARPDLMLCFVVYVCVSFSIFRAGVVCFIAGYCLEALSGSVDGLYVLVYVGICLSIRLLKKTFNFDSLPELVLLLGMCIVIKLIILLFFFEILTEFPLAGMPSVFWRETLYTLGMFPPVFLLLCKYHDPRSLNETYTTLSNVRRIS